MNQLTMFGPAARSTDDRTSHEAAARMAVASPHLKAQILDLFSKHRTLIKDQVCQLLEVDARRWPSVASALSQLKNSGHLTWTGEVVLGQNVWRLREQSVDVKGDRL